MHPRKYTVTFKVGGNTPPEVAQQSPGGQFHCKKWKRAAFLVGEMVRWGYDVTVTASNRERDGTEYSDKAIA